MSVPTLLTVYPEGSPDTSAIVKPLDGRWQLLVDKKGYPHLYLQVTVENDDKTLEKGLLCLDDLLPDEMSIRSLMDGGHFGPTGDPEAEAKALEQYEADRKGKGIPEPAKSV